MSKIKFNISKLEDFKNSKFCPQQLVDQDNDQLFESIKNNASLTAAYDQFCYLRWYSEYQRRVQVATEGKVQPTLQDRINMRKQVEALQQEQKRIKPRTDNIVTQPLQIELFGNIINEKQWSKLELAVRQQFLQEVAQAKKSGGCSGCKRNALVRKYMARLKELKEEV